LRCRFSNGTEDMLDAMRFEVGCHRVHRLASNPNLTPWRLWFHPIRDLPTGRSHTSHSSIDL
jgi:hypothetical protein